LLRYRKICTPLIQEKRGFSVYDLRLGLWKNENNEPLIGKFMKGIIHEVYGTTMETRTREGIDRSENSDDTNALLLQSVVTFTREAIDRSETSK
jgi:hypothetical protein